MSDIEFEDLFNYPPLSCTSEYINGALEGLQETAAFEPHPSLEAATIHLNSHDDIEEIYTGLHRGVEQVVARLSAHTPPHLDNIREHNRQLIGKLRSLDRAITEDVASVRRGSSSRSSPHSGPSASDVDSSHLEMSKKRRRIMHATSFSGAEKDALSNSEESSCLTRPEVDSKLAKKLLLVGNQETKSQLAEFKTRLEAPECYVAHSNGGHLAFRQFTDMPHFLRVLMDLGMAIENSSFGEQSSRIKKRIALAQFYKAYSLAQSQPEIFLSWCENKMFSGSSLMPKGGYKSIVQHRFAELIFSRAEVVDGTVFTRFAKDEDDIKRRIAKIQTWRKTGKKWAEMTQRFGYGILLLLPPCLSDEDLRISSDKDFTRGLDLIDSRKHLFMNILQEANHLLELQITPNGLEAELIQAGISS